MTKGGCGTDENKERGDELKADEKGAVFLKYGLLAIAVK